MQDGVQLRLETGGDPRHLLREFGVCLLCVWDYCEGAGAQERGGHGAAGGGEAVVHGAGTGGGQVAGRFLGGDELRSEVERGGVSVGDGSVIVSFVSFDELSGSSQLRLHLLLFGAIGRQQLGLPLLRHSVHLQLSLEGSGAARDE